MNQETEDSLTWCNQGEFNEEMISTCIRYTELCGTSNGW